MHTKRVCLLVGSVTGGRTRIEQPLISSLQIAERAEEADVNGGWAHSHWAFIDFGVLGFF
jgi:hypothetical protein